MIELGVSSNKIVFTVNGTETITQAKQIIENSIDSIKPG